MALERNGNAFSGDPIRSGRSGNQGTDGMGQVLRCISRVAQDISYEGLTLMDRANKGSWSVKSSPSDVQTTREEGKEDLHQAQFDKGQPARSETASLIISSNSSKAPRITAGGRCREGVQP